MKYIKTPIFKVENQSGSLDLRTESLRPVMSKQLRSQNLFLKTGINQKSEWAISILQKQSNKR
jgi:hypothetical protein